MSMPTRIKNGKICTAVDNCLESNLAPSQHFAPNPRQHSLFLLVTSPPGRKTSGFLRRLFWACPQSAVWKSALYARKTSAYGWHHFSAGCGFRFRSDEIAGAALIGRWLPVAGTIIQSPQDRLSCRARLMESHRFSPYAIIAASSVGWQILSMHWTAYGTLLSNEVWNKLPELQEERRFEPFHSPKLGIHPRQWTSAYDFAVICSRGFVWGRVLQRTISKCAMWKRFVGL